MSGNDEHRYDDIIDLPHPVSSKHPQMPLADRAAQFAPFAALTGHEAAIKETARLTEEELFLDENSKELLDAELRYVQEHLSERPEVTVTYFQPDERKSGGVYVTVTGRVKKVDAYARKIVMEDGGLIPMDEVIGMTAQTIDKE